MHAFYQPEITQGNNLLSKEESHHMLKVLRLKDGEEIFLLDGKGQLAHANIIGKEGSLAKVQVSSIEKHGINKPEIKLFIAPPKSSDRLDFIIEKATELGVAEIHFLHCRNSERKNVRIDKIEQKVLAACKQSLQSHFPIVHDLKGLQEIDSYLVEDALLFHCHDDIERKLIERTVLEDKLCLFIGPEGDFSKDEVKSFISNGAKSTSLGEMRMRTETAVLSAIVKSQTLHFLQHN